MQQKKRFNRKKNEKSDTKKTDSKDGCNCNLYIDVYIRFNIHTQQSVDR